MVIETPDLLMLGGIVLAISVLASLLGIWKAMSVEPNKVLPYEHCRKSIRPPSWPKTSPRFMAAATPRLWR